MRAAALTCALLAVGCVGRAPARDVDAGPNDDDVDAGAGDVDAGDAGSSDGGPDDDAGASDVDAGASDVDAGASDVDAGASDAGASDSGVDAGSDSGVDTSDSGVEDDAGPDPLAIGLDARPSSSACTAPARPPVAGSVARVEPWPDVELRSPLLMLEEPAAPSGAPSRIYVVERGGRIQRFLKDDAGVTVPELFADISARVLTVDSGSTEAGLLGMAFHPDWPAVDEIFLAYDGFDAQLNSVVNVIARFHVGADGTLDEDSEEILIAIDDFAENHNAGTLAFSPTDPCRSCLYVGTGDGGGGGDPLQTGQDPQSLLGKFLRIDVDRAEAGLPYGIPPDNAFVNDAAYRPEIHAIGFRNPWRWSFDRDSGELWAGDVGQNFFEEIDVVEAGGNYGWDILEGDNCHEETAGTCTQGGFQAPVTTYAHNGNHIAVIGGYVYRGASMPALVGQYIYADHASREILALRFDAQGEAVPEIIGFVTDRISSFSEDADGELYVVNHAQGTIEKLVAAGAPPPDTFPQTLSASGCADTSALLPYGVNHELWSDGADKQRFLALADDARATILGDGDIDFPVGTVFRKDFSAGGMRIETRLLMRHDDGDWAGYSYEWAGDDAALVPVGGKTRTLANGQQWTYPSRSGCLACHSLAARRVLGWETAQLNGFFTYEATGITANQLRTLDAIGVFAAPLPAPPADLPALAPRGSGAVEAEARALLHVNCSICHRPGGIGAGDTDMRVDVPLAGMGLCDVDPTEGDLGVAGARRLAPGDPARSLVSLRMRRLGAARMPLLGSVVVDDLGVAAVDAWIEGLAGCP